MKTKTATMSWVGALCPGVLPLAEATDVTRCGGKASFLARIARCGFLVPPGFVVTDEVFQGFLDQHSLRQNIAARCSDSEAWSVGDRRHAVSGIRDLILDAPLAEHLRDGLITLRRHLGDDNPLVVRSSGVGEDGATHSFAGLMDSFLNVNTVSQLERALKACWASYWSERCLRYQLTKGARLNGMGVVIQKQVCSRISGVLFTRRPDGDGGRSAELLVEYCFGYGDQLVSGLMTPGRITISRRRLSWRVDLPPEQDGEDGLHDLLGDIQIRVLAETGLALEREFGCPQDIEWTIASDGRVCFLQSRPITAAATARCSALWSNANINENYPEPVCPLLYSIAADGYYHYFGNLGRAFGISRRRLYAMEYSLRHLIGAHGGRLYYNLSNIHAVLRLAPFGHALAAFFNQFIGANEEPEAGQSPESGRITGGGLGRWWELARIVVKTTRQYLFLTGRVEAFERTVEDLSEQITPAGLERLPLGLLRRHFRSFLEIRFHRWTNAALADTAAMVCSGVLKRLLGQAFPLEDPAALQNSLLKGLGGVVSSAPTVKLWDFSRRIREHTDLLEFFRSQGSAEILDALRTDARWSSFAAELDHYLNQWGFRCSGELMLTVPSFQECPEKLVDILKTYVGLDGESPHEVLRRQHAERLAMTERLLKDLFPRGSWRFLIQPAQVWLVKLWLAWTQRAIVLRERARFKQALLYNRARLIIVAIGECLVARGDLQARNDVFFLTYQELDDLLSGCAMFPAHVRELVAVRRTAHREVSTMAPPDTFIISEGAYLDRSSMQSAGDRVWDGSLMRLKGVGVCGGQATGRAVVLAEMGEAHRLVPGDVLVVRQTDPGWGAVFFLIKGLVIERGGLLSHGAILAREFGIPTVVGVRNAATLIPEGARVTVDGDRGSVQVLG